MLAHHETMYMAGTIFANYGQHHEDRKSLSHHLSTSISSPLEGLCSYPRASFSVPPLSECLFCRQRWSRLSEQNLRVDKWNVCRG
jgi:hypothetical protein